MAAGSHDAGPAIYAKTPHLVRLWNIKADLAEARPFSAALDMHHAALDAVLAFTFGESIRCSALVPQIELLSDLDGKQSIASDDTDAPVKFPEAPLDDLLVSAIETLINSPWPRWTLVDEQEGLVQEHVCCQGTLHP